MAPILNTLDTHRAVQYAIILLAVFIVVEIISRLKGSRAKQMAVIGLSILFLGWLDLRSLALLTLFSSTIFGMVKARLRLSHIIYPLSLLLIAVLLLIKDLSVLGWIQTPYVPLGVSYYFFRLISFLIEYSKKPEEMAKITPLGIDSTQVVLCLSIVRGKLDCLNVGLPCLFLIP